MNDVILFLNGAFGAGKSQAAYELARRLDRAVVCDPEQAGFGLHRMTPRPLRGDFQDFRSWRAGVVEVLDRVDVSGAYDVVIAPMTLVDEAYRNEILDGLVALGHDVRHVVLDASSETLHRRLSHRAVAALGREDSWALQQIDRCLTGLARPDTERVRAARVGTDEASHDEVVEAVAAAAGLTLARGRHGRWGRATQTALTSLRVVRL